MKIEDFEFKICTINKKIETFLSSSSNLIIAIRKNKLFVTKFPNISYYNSIKEKLKIFNPNKIFFVCNQEMELGFKNVTKIAPPINSFIGIKKVIYQNNKLSFIYNV